MLSSTLDGFPRGQIDLERFAFLIRKVGKPALEHGFCGRDELDDNGVPIGNGGVDGWQQARQLHRQKQLREKALLGALEDRQRCRLGARVERPAGFAVDDPCGLQRIAQVCVNDRLSRGSGNAEERGVVLQSCGTFRHVLHIIL